MSGLDGFAETPFLPSNISFGGSEPRRFEHQNESGLSAVEAALKLNPAANRSLKYAVMVHLTEAGRVLARGGSREEIVRVANEVRDALKGIAGSLSLDDPSLRATTAALALLDANS